MNLYGPAWFAVTVYGGGCELYKPRFEGMPPQGGHAMTLVGYDEDGLIFQNSWGTDWCEGGLSRIPWSEAMDHIEEIDFYEDDNSFGTDDDDSDEDSADDPYEDPADDEYGVECPDGSMAECCDIDESCSDGDDDFCCSGEFYCSNDGADYAAMKGGILCPGVETSDSCESSEDYDGACGLIDGVHVSCDTCCSMFGNCRDGFFACLRTQEEYSDGNCPADTSLETAMLQQEAVGSHGFLKTATYVFALFGLAVAVHGVYSTVRSRVKPYAQINIVCDEEM